MEIRTKDKVFLAFFLPVAIVGAYVYFWRTDVAKAVASLESRHDALVAVDDFPLEKRIRDARIVEAEKELSDEKATPRAEPCVVADAASAVAWREREATRVFIVSGLSVMRCEAVDASGDGAVAPFALSATGVRPSPVCRRWTLDGSYPAIKRALDAFCRERMAVVPESLQMRPSGFGRWTLQMWL